VDFVSVRLRPSGIAVLGFAIAVKWKLRRRVWFWITMTIIVALHVLMILYVPWTTQWMPAMAIAGIFSADLCVMFVILAVVESVMEGRRPLNDERPQS
jgi:hypothetical protein